MAGLMWLGVAVPYATNIRIYPEIKKQKMRKGKKKRESQPQLSPLKLLKKNPTVPFSGLCLEIKARHFHKPV
jgi:hypothetical protein